MEEKEPDKYVADLLKQLEELKKKKAHKERKLMKLKSSAHKDPHKAQRLTSSLRNPSSCSKVLKSSLVSENGYNCNQIFAEDKITHNDDYSNKKDIFAISDSILSKNIKENFLKPNSELFEYHKLKNKTRKNSDVEAHVDVPAASFSDSNTNRNINSPCADNEEFEESVLKSNLNATHNKENIKDISVLQHDEVNVNDELLKCDAEVPSPFQDKSHQLDLDNICNVKEDHNSAKDNLLSNNKEAGLDMNDPLDNNMSCFLSSHMLIDDADNIKGNNQNKDPEPGDNFLSSHMLIDDADNIKGNNQNKDPEPGDNFLSSHMLIDDADNNIKGCSQSKDPEPGDNEMRTCIPDFKISPSFSLSFSSDSQQTNFSVLDFPKFSSPTDIQCHMNETVPSNLFHRAESPKICGESETLANGFQNCKSENIKMMNSSPKHSLQENKISSLPESKISPLQLNAILGNGLSSILDAHYASPVKPPVAECSINANLNLVKTSNTQTAAENSSKKRKLFSVSNIASDLNQKREFDISQSVTEIDEANLCKKIALDQALKKIDSIVENNFPSHLVSDSDQCMEEDIDFGNTTFDSFSDSFNDSKTVCPETALLLTTDDSNKVISQVSKTVDELINEVCKDPLVSDIPTITENNLELSHANVCKNNKECEVDVLMIPETEGLGQYFQNDTEDFLETSTLSESLSHFQIKNNWENQSRLASAVVNSIVLPVNCIENQPKCSNNNNSFHKENVISKKLGEVDGERKVTDNSIDCANFFPDSLNLDSSFLEDDTQNLGNYKQVPYMNEENIQGDPSKKCTSQRESNLNFKGFLYGSTNEPVIDIEIILFNNIKYAFIQHETQVHVWKQEKNKDWIRIYQHQIENMLSLNKIGTSVDEENLVLVMLLSNNQKFCLQFLHFEKDAKGIKFMENTHWLEERFSKESVLLCGLYGLMFATAQYKENHEVSLHAFISLKDSPQLMTAPLGSTDVKLCSLCKIDKLPNALMGISNSMLYVWHIIEARLVTSVSLHPLDYLPIKTCFWATVEKGLIYFLTTCEGENDFEMCQLLAANLATGFCQCAMTYSTQPSKAKRKIKIAKAAYLEPFLVVSHSGGAFLWSVTEEYCCAALSTKSEITTVAISRDTEDWGLLALGTNFGCVTCYNIH